ncbi:hypothetical protein MPTK1_5g18540 [Marchantia polymorpha subsp. ruderalis]|uniref:Uncharacterized protein n=2 Tax=Marchantia polymorpha TaxID=3197 RepID=A0AAF6BJR9_MARPO|nr:hypothetical protein MARPO_0073s0086 [Marchantia polymorpha]BBN12253.1 hypothetical protein Mp_5g18540 [Marchantia polymorpha subsp. ruderalis]|eukprot:PTQ35222.1 hypothetical protein MARPO_0073s0086 [Marchantia polymorpha]
MPSLRTTQTQVCHSSQFSQVHSCSVPTSSITTFTLYRAQINSRRITALPRLFCPKLTSRIVSSCPRTDSRKYTGVHLAGSCKKIKKYPVGIQRNIIWVITSFFFLISSSLTRNGSLESSAYLFLILSRNSLKLKAAFSFTLYGK